MRTIDNRTEDTVVNVLNVFLGIALFLAPWYLGLGSETAAACNALMCGSTISIIAALALSQSYDWEQYLNLALSIWVAAAPWVFGFTEISEAMKVHVEIGLAVAVLAGFELRRLYHSPDASFV